MPRRHGRRLHVAARGDEGVAIPGHAETPPGSVSPHAYATDYDALSADPWRQMILQSAASVAC